MLISLRYHHILKIKRHYIPLKPLFNAFLITSFPKFKKALNSCGEPSVPRIWINDILFRQKHRRSVKLLFIPLRNIPFFKFFGSGLSHWCFSRIWSQSHIIGLFNRKFPHFRNALKSKQNNKSQFRCI